MDGARAAEKYGVSVIADGGIRHLATLPMIAAGASSAMLGSFAGFTKARGSWLFSRAAV